MSTSTPSHTSDDPAITLARRIREAQDHFEAADAERRRVFAVAYDSGAMTFNQIGEAAGLTHSIVRSLTAQVRGTGTARKNRAADSALSLLDG